MAVALFCVSFFSENFLLNYSFGVVQRNLQCTNKWKSIFSWKFSHSIDFCIGQVGEVKQVRYQKNSDVYTLVTFLTRMVINSFMITKCYFNLLNMEQSDSTHWVWNSPAGFETNVGTELLVTSLLLSGSQTIELSRHRSWLQYIFLNEWMNP